MTAQLIREAYNQPGTDLPGGKIKWSARTAQIAVDGTMWFSRLPESRDEADAINDQARVIVARLNLP